LLTDSSEKENIHKGFSLGANDYFLKTFDTELLEKRIETLLCMNLQHNLLDTRKKDITELQNAIIETLTDTIEFRDEVTGGHVLRTQKHMEALIQGLLEKGFYTKTLSSWNLDYFIHSVQLHDVGKIGIPDNILKKCDRLTCEEFEIMKSHVVIGREIIQRIMKKTSKHEFLDFALAITISHHERWNGTGYPLGLKGTNIPLEGRLMALVDVYDALVSWRPYKDKKSHEKAMKIIEDESGTHFDPLIVEAFKHVEQRFKEIDLAFS
jgi:putative two-component system response regulator